MHILTRMTWFYEFKLKNDNLSYKEYFGIASKLKSLDREPIQVYDSSFFLFFCGWYCYATSTHTSDEELGNEEMAEWELEEEEMEEPDNPYDHNLDVDAGAHISDEDLKDQLKHLPQTPAEPTLGMHSETLVVDRNIVASRLVHLQNRGIIMYTVDFYPYWNQFQEWVQRWQDIRWELPLSKLKSWPVTFLIVVSKPAKQRAILLEPCWYMGRKMIVTQPLSWFLC